MWKLAVGFLLFAALAMYILTKSGGDIDLGGERHGVEAPPAAASGVPLSAPGAGSAPKN